MKVKELIEALKKVDQEKEVMYVTFESNVEGEDIMDYVSNEIFEVETNDSEVYLSAIKL